MDSGYNHLSCSFFFQCFFSVFVRFISTDDSLKALSSLGKKRKASQGTEDMTEDHAVSSQRIMNIYVDDFAC